MNGSLRRRRVGFQVPVVAALVASAFFCAGEVSGQEAQIDPNTDLVRKFTQTRWSQIIPDKDYEGGCVVGFLAFSFSPTGYFVFNNRIRGSWRVDELGNLKLRTRDGVLFTMIVDGTTIRPSRTIDFLKRTNIFQRCPE